MRLAKIQFTYHPTAEFKMHPQKIGKYSEQLSKIALDVQSIEYGDTDFAVYAKALQALPNDLQRKLDELIERFAREPGYSNTHSERFMSNAINQALNKLISDPKQKAIDLVGAITTEIESYNNTNTVFLCIDGLTVDKEVELGRVSIKMFNDDDIQEIIISNKLEFSEDENISLEAETFLRKQMQSELKGKCVAKYVILAEPGRAYERAKDETRRVIDILRFSSKFLNPLPEDIRIGIRGDHPRATRKGVVIGEKLFAIRSDSVGSPQAFHIDQATLSDMQTIGALKVSEFLQEETPSEYREIIIKAVHWFSLALTQAEIENKFLLLIICLEVIFTTNNAPISNTIAESVAFLLGDSSTRRKELKKEIKDFYSIRSAIAHGGNKPISDFELYKLLATVANTIMTLTDNSDAFATRADLMEHIETLKFS